MNSLMTTQQQGTLTFFFPSEECSFLHNVNGVGATCLRLFSASSGLSSQIRGPSLAFVHAVLLCYF